MFEVIGFVVMMLIISIIVYFGSRRFEVDLDYEHAKEVVDRWYPYFFEQGAQGVGIGAEYDEWILVVSFPEAMPEGLPDEVEGVRVIYEENNGTIVAQ
jgi:hypothetical protein